MLIFKKKKICVTHDGSFHADDLFATAILCLYYNGNVKIIRTRDQDLIKKADIVYDVSGIYDPKTNHFDHHQGGGAGKRSNGIDYASFGLIWKHFGMKLCNNNVEVWKIIDNKIVAPIDAIDNGMDIMTPLYDDVIPYDLEQAFLVYIPTWEENNKNIDKIFKKQVKKIIELMKREIVVAQSEVRGKDLIMKAYHDSEDGKIIVSDISFSRYFFQKILSVLPEPLYFICPSSHSNNIWKVETIHKDLHTMDSRKLFPESWRGFFHGDEKLIELTGVNDVMFCHRAGFLMTTKSKEGAIALAQKALLA